MFGANLVNPAQIYDELSCRKGKVYGQTDGRTDGGNDKTPSEWKGKGYKKGGGGLYRGVCQPINLIYGVPLAKGQ